MIRKFFITILIAILILIPNNILAQENVDLSAEMRYFTDETTPEFMFEYGNFSLDCINDDSQNFFKLKKDKDIFSLMGTGLKWNVSLNAVDGDFSILPSVGVNLYMRIRPQLDIYVQYSGLSFGRREHVSDFEAGMKYFFREDFSISTGWRHIDFKMRHGGNFDLSGVFVGIRYDF